MNRRHGVVLIVVLVVAGLTAMLAAGVLFAVRAEVAATAAGSRGLQADAAATSGLRMAIAAIQQGLDVYDDPATFCNRIVYDDGAEQWYFTVYAPAGDGTRVRYGLSDEASKININLADEATLAALLPDSPALVDCLLDYRDADDEVRPQGAEAEYYAQLPLPYPIKNGLLLTVEELLMIKGFSGPVVYGEDANLNGILDPNEDDGSDFFPPDNGDGLLDTGLRGLATTLSYEPNTDREGRDRVNLNDPSAVSRAGLSNQTRQFIQLYLSEGNVFKHPSELLNMQYTLKNNHGNDPQTRAGMVIRSGVGGGQLPNVLDRLTTMPSGRRAMLAGLVNVNTASARVLELVGIESSLAEQVVSGRSSLDADTRSTIAWLFTERLLDARTFKAVAPRLTARSFQYRVQCVGFGSPSGRFKVIEAIIDTARGGARVVYLRDLTRLGLPFAPDFDNFPPH